MADELASYNLQLQQVEAALLGEPYNEELLKLRQDLEEIIKLQEELLQENSNGSQAASTQPLPSWKVGDKVLALSINGQHYPAVIDGFSGDTVAVTFIGNNKKHLCRRNDLKEAPADTKKNYAFESNSSKGWANKKNEWQAERERRKLRAQKKEIRKKELETAKEGEKNKWINFNSKASAKGFKGMKRVIVTGSAPDGPAFGMKSSTVVSSRRDLNAFTSTQRGNMDSLF